MRNDLDKNKKVLNVPNLRFKKYKDSWKIVSLSEIVIRVTRKNKLNESLLPLTISAQHGLIDQTTFFGKTVASKDLSNYYLLFRGDFAYNKSYSKDYPWGAVKRLNNYDKGVVSNLYICFKPYNVNSDFLECYFETTKWNKGISNIAGEGARNHGLLNMSTSDFFCTKHYIPSIDEQISISGLIKKINSRIMTQNKIIEDLFLLKKSITHDVFNKPSSEKNKLCNLIDISTGKRDANESDERGIYPFFTCGKETLKINKYSFEGESLLISGNGEIGQVKYYSGKFDAYQRTYVLQNSKIPILYLKAYLEFILPMIVEREKQQSAMPYIVLGTLKNIDVPILDINKTNSIISIFKAIDKKIERENKYKELLNKEKRYLLNNLFI